MKKPPIWQLPAILVASVGALGTAAVVTARYVNLPAQVEAGEQKNVQQDKQIDRLITLQEYYAKQQTPNQSMHPSRTVTPQEWQDPNDGSWWYCSQFCDKDENWRKYE